MAERKLEHSDKIILPQSYPGNSHKQKEEESSKKEKVVIKGKVKKVNNPAKSFFKEDITDVASYVIWEVLFPNLKNLVWEMGSNGLEMFLFGEVKAKSRKGEKFTEYGKYFREDGSRKRDRKAQARGDVEDIWFESKQEASDVLDDLLLLIEVNEEVAVSEYYEMIGMDISSSDQDYGWRNLSRARIVPARGGGYILELPRPKYLD